MKVLKFWGTSVGSQEMIQKVAKIVKSEKEKNDVVVVVSAMSGVTDSLIELCEYTQTGDIEKVEKFLKILKKKHIEVAQNICQGKCDIYFIKKIEEYISQLEDIARGVCFLRQLSDRGRAKILYFWEILSSLIVSLALTQEWLESKNYLSKEFLMCKKKYMDGDCDYKLSKKIIKHFFQHINIQKEIPVITGFGWWDDEGNVFLFDRWGSDYVGTLIWRFLEAESVEIWTDVNGVMSADPRIVKDAILWEKLDYSVCAEFALVGAKVLHPKTISPLQEVNIPVIIKNTFNPEAEGTKITQIKSKGIKGIHIDTKQTILSFIDPTMIGTAWYIADVIAVFSRLQIPIDTLATTETSFSLSIKSKYYNAYLIREIEKLKEHFHFEVEEEIAKISLVGNDVSDYSILEDLEKIILVSRWAYGKSLTIFVKTCDAKNLIQKLHKKIFWK